MPVAIHCRESQRDSAGQGRNVDRGFPKCDISAYSKAYHLPATPGVIQCLLYKLCDRSYGYGMTFWIAIFIHANQGFLE